MSKKAVVLFSGGVDSTTCLAMAIERYGKENVIPLSIFMDRSMIENYEQRKRYSPIMG